MLADDVADTAGRSVQIIYSDAIQKHFLLSFPMTQDAHSPQNKALASRLDEKKNPNEKQYWININGLQWFHERIHCIFMQLAVARHNKLAKTSEGNRTYAPAIRSFAFFYSSEWIHWVSSLVLVILLIFRVFFTQHRSRCCVSSVILRLSLLHPSRIPQLALRVKRNLKNP